MIGFWLFSSNFLNNVNFFFFLTQGGPGEDSGTSEDDETGGAENVSISSGDVTLSHICVCEMCR